MKLFNYYDSLVIDAIIDFYRNGETTEDFKESFTKIFGDYADQFYDTSASIQDYYSILKTDDNETFTSLYEDKFDYDEDPSFPKLLNKVELDAIRTAIHSEIAKAYLTSKQLDTLQEVFSYDEYENPNTEWDERDIIKRFILKKEKDSSFYINMQLITNAILNKNKLSITNTTSTKVYSNEIIYPICYEFTRSTTSWTLTAYSESSKRFINLNISKLSNIKIVGKMQNPEDIEQKYRDFIKKDKMGFVTIQLNNPKNYINDRFFRVFSSYKKITDFKKKDNSYTITLSYYKFDENFLIRNILNFGPSIEVVEPKILRYKIKQEIAKCLK